jgi:hypothetical protein
LLEAFDSGFSLLGDDADLVLTSFALLQLEKMKATVDFVDQNLIDRQYAFIEGKRLNETHFDVRNSPMRDQIEAYVLYNLLQIPNFNTSSYTKAIEALELTGFKSNDPIVKSLAALVMYHANMVHPAFRIAFRLRDYINKTTGEMSAVSSISGA